MQGRYAKAYLHIIKNNKVQGGGGCGTFWTPCINLYAHSFCVTLRYQDPLDRFLWLKCQLKGPKTSRSAKTFPLVKFIVIRGWKSLNLGWILRELKVITVIMCIVCKQTKNVKNITISVVTVKFINRVWTMDTPACFVSKHISTEN